MGMAAPTKSWLLRLARRHPLVLLPCFGGRHCPRGDSGQGEAGKEADHNGGPLRASRGLPQPTAYVQHLTEPGRRPPPRVAQALMRHADLKTTMKRYTHVEMLDRVHAVESLPCIAMEAPQELRMAAGAESAVLTPVQTNGAPSTALGGTASHNGPERETPPNGGFGGVHSSLGTHKPTVAQHGKKGQKDTPCRIQTCGLLLRRQALYSLS